MQHFRDEGGGWQTCPQPQIMSVVHRGKAGHPSTHEAEGCNCNAQFIFTNHKPANVIVWITVNRDVISGAMAVDANSGSGPTMEFISSSREAPSSLVHSL